MNKNGITRNFTGEILTLTLDRGPRNTLTTEMMQELEQIFQKCQLSTADRPRVIILESGIDKCFSFGVDPTHFLEQDPEGRREIFRTLGRMVYAMLGCGIPIISVVNGPAFAGGAVLAFLADFLLMHQDNAQIAFSEAKVRLPMPKFLQNLINNKLIGHARTSAWLLGKNFTAQDLQSLGAASGVFRNEEEKKKLIADLCNKILRLDGEVLKFSLIEDRKDLHDAYQDFCDRFDKFAEFLSDQYLGRSLRELNDRR